jgi:hypothetical protein
MAPQELHYFDEKPEGWADVSPPFLLWKAPTGQYLGGRLLLPRLPISTQGIFSSMASISGCSDLALQPQLALGVS